MSEFKYACGFLFDAAMESVLLIRKNKPEKQNGRLNGVGGKLEEGENFHDAMVREFEEEAGMRVEDWKMLAALVGKDYQVNFFWTISDLSQAKSMTDEKLEIMRLDDLLKSKEVLTNLKWIIPRAFDRTIQPLLAMELE